MSRRSATLYACVVRGEQAFALVELLAALAIVGILLAIAIPSYLEVRQRAWESAAAADVRVAIPAAEAYLLDNGSYAGMTLAALTAIDPAVELDPSHGVVVSRSGSGYTLCQRVGNASAQVAGPSGTITVGTGAC